MTGRSASESNVGVLQLIDTLEVGGAERVAVNLANSLPRDRFRSYLATTRRDGPLAQLVAGDVGRLRLDRRSRFEPSAVFRLRRYVAENRIEIVHAHGSSLFLAVAAFGLAHRRAIVWHDHFGPNAASERPVPLYQIAAKRVAAVIAVSEPLAEWSRRRLKVAEEKVWYLPNFVPEAGGGDSVTGLPGSRGSRIVCVANLRPPKDHVNLFRAMERVVREVPSAHLLLVGEAHDPVFLSGLQSEVARLNLAGHVSFLGMRQDVTALLRGCDVGVLASSSEGLPLALVEYAMAGLPAVATRVGQCEDVLDGGRTGLLVPPSKPEELAKGIISLLEDAGRRADLAELGLLRARRLFSVEANIQKLCGVYKTVHRALTE